MTVSYSCMERNAQRAAAPGTSQSHLSSQAVNPPQARVAQRFWQTQKPNVSREIDSFVETHLCMLRVTFDRAYCGVLGFVEDRVCKLRTDEPLHIGRHSKRLAIPLAIENTPNKPKTAIAKTSDRKRGEVSPSEVSPLSNKETQRKTFMLLDEETRCKPFSMILPPQKKKRNSCH